MSRLEHLQAQARKCRTLASGLTNREDVRMLEQLAREYEAEARSMMQRPPREARAAAY